MQGYKHSKSIKKFFFSISKNFHCLAIPQKPDATIWDHFPWIDISNELYFHLIGVPVGGKHFCRHVKTNWIFQRPVEQITNAHFQDVISLSFVNQFSSVKAHWICFDKWGVQICVYQTLYKWHHFLDLKKLLMLGTLRFSRNERNLAEMGKWNGEKKFTRQICEWEVAEELLNWRMVVP